MKLSPLNLAIVTGVQVSVICHWESIAFHSPLTVPLYGGSWVVMSNFVLSVVTVKQLSLPCMLVYFFCCASFFWKDVQPVAAVLVCFWTSGVWVDYKLSPYCSVTCCFVAWPVHCLMTQVSKYLSLVTEIPVPFTVSVTLSSVHQRLRGAEHFLFEFCVFVCRSQSTVIVFVSTKAWQGNDWEFTFVSRTQNSLYFVL
jgi:hypothetical protein